MCEEGIGMGKTCASFVLQLSVIFAVLKFGQNVKVPMKVVDEPVNYEYMHFCLEILYFPLLPDIKIERFDFRHGAVDTGTLLLRQAPSNDWSKTTRPANFSGPPHLRQLLGHCFSWSDQKYVLKNIGGYFYANLKCLQIQV